MRRKLNKSYLGSPESPFELTTWNLITRADSMAFYFLIHHNIEYILLAQRKKIILERREEKDPASLLFNQLKLPIFLSGHFEVASLPKELV